jgi:hypothetical protein
LNKNKLYNKLSHLIHQNRVRSIRLDSLYISPLNYSTNQWFIFFFLCIKLSFIDFDCIFLLLQDIFNHWFKIHFHLFYFKMHWLIQIDLLRFKLLKFFLMLFNIYLNFLSPKFWDAHQLLLLLSVDFLYFRAATWKSIYIFCLLFIFLRYA